MNSNLVDDLEVVLGPKHNHSKYQRWFLVYAWSLTILMAGAIALVYKTNGVASLALGSDLGPAVFGLLFINSLWFALYLQFNKNELSAKKNIIFCHITIQLAIGTVFIIGNFFK